MFTNALKLRRSPNWTAEHRRFGFAPARSPFDAASLAIVAVLALLFAAAITGALQPAHLVDPAQASLQGGL
jgi:hypothetical protein